jgi:hypothetical protein
VPPTLKGRGYIDGWKVEATLMDGRSGLHFRINLKVCPYNGEV